VLTKIDLINFKSFLNTSLEMRPLTVLTGLNSSGKSSVIQAINMVAAAYQKKTVALPEHASPHLLKSMYSKDSFFALVIQDDKGNNFKMKVHVTPDEYSLQKIQRGDNRVLPAIQYISASRLGPQNALPTNPEYSYSKIGLKGEYVIDYIEKNRDMAITSSLIKASNGLASLMDNIDAWLQYISPGSSLDYEINRRQNTAYPYYNGFMPTESGFGLSYTLPVITVLLAAEPDTVVLLENPEAHLHPQGQTAMGELAALAAAAGKQVIIETHSDHVIDGIRIMARRKQIDNTSVVFHYISKDGTNNPSTVETPQLLPDGKLSFWPRGFFDQNMLNKAELLKK